VLRSISLFLVACALAAVPNHRLGAQDNETTVTLTVGPSFVDFEFGSFGAAVARLSVSRGFTRRTGGELSTFVLAPTGRASAQPGCIPGAACETRTTPSVLFGQLASLFADAGETGLRATVGGGASGSAGSEGFENRSSLAGLVGLDWIPRSDNRFAPTFSFRFLQLAKPIAGARQLLLPGIGFSF
jgi:hypothetical protein